MAWFYPQTSFWLDAPLLSEVLFYPDIAPAVTFLPLQSAVAVGPKSHHLGLCRGLYSHRTSSQSKIFFLVSFTNFTQLNLCSNILILDLKTYFLKPLIHIFDLSRIVLNVKK
jgi:hypothetical protein